MNKIFLFCFIFAACQKIQKPSCEIATIEAAYESKLKGKEKAVGKIDPLSREIYLELPDDLSSAGLRLSWQLKTPFARISLESPFIFEVDFEKKIPIQVSYEDQKCNYELKIEKLSLETLPVFIIAEKYLQIALNKSKTSPNHLYYELLSDQKLAQIQVQINNSQEKITLNEIETGFWQGILIPPAGEPYAKKISVETNFYAHFLTLNGFEVEMPRPILPDLWDTVKVQARFVADRIVFPFLPPSSQMAKVKLPPETSFSCNNRPTILNEKPFLFDLELQKNCILEKGENQKQYSLESEKLPDFVGLKHLLCDEEKCDYTIKENQIFLSAKPTTLSTAIFYEQYTQGGNCEEKEDHFLCKIVPILAPEYPAVLKVFWNVL